MVRLALPFLALLLLAACGEDEADPTGPVGVWVLDKPSFERAIAAAMETLGTPENERAFEIERVAESTYAMELFADGTWQARGSHFGQELDTRGTWSREGETLTLVTKSVHGAPAGRIAATQTATFTGEAIVMENELRTDVVLEMRLRRK